jgi:hypothetical protein
MGQVPLWLADDMYPRSNALLRSLTELACWQAGMRHGRPDMGAPSGRIRRWATPFVAHQPREAAVHTLTAGAGCDCCRVSCATSARGPSRVADPTFRTATTARRRCQMVTWCVTGTYLRTQYSIQCTIRPSGRGPALGGTGGALGGSSSEQPVGQEAAVVMGIVRAVK